ncbi:MAG: PEP-CTERM sorting domain-containing protein [Armatimonadota bacterium]
MSWDLAFEISTVPEPGSMVALSTGLAGLVGFILRRRR